MSSVVNQEDQIMSESFPFALEDIKSWIIKRKDGVSVRYNLVPKGQDGVVRKSTPLPTRLGSFSSHRSFSDWCSHTPHTDNPPIFSDGKVSIWIADSQGARKSQDLFDVCIDGGNVLDVPGQHDLPNLYGDPGLVKNLSEYAHRYQSSIVKTGPKILKIRWADRCPPPCYPSFWPALNDYLHKLAEKKKDGPLKVLTICQGGHGRSGSALVALVMCMTDYTPLDALTHIRALHCARAIESKDQHVYLNHLAEHLGRPQNALEAETVKSFKDRFLSLDNPYAEPYKDRVKIGKGALVNERDGGYL